MPKAHSKAVRGPSPHTFKQATNTANLTLQPADCKSLNPNILPIKSLFSRFCRTYRPSNSANCHACNDLEEAFKKNYSATSTTKSLFSRILPTNYLDSRFCAEKSMANRTNSNEINILNVDVGKLENAIHTRLLAFHPQAFGCGILGRRVKQSVVAWRMLPRGSGLTTHD